MNNVNIPTEETAGTQKNYKKGKNAYSDQNMDRIIRDPRCGHTHMVGSECENEENVAGYDADHDDEKGESPAHKRHLG